MSNDEDWVADVRRWYFGGTEPEGDRWSQLSEASSTYEAALGYEAANPTLQSRHWPDAPTVANDLHDCDTASDKDRPAH